MYDAHALCKHLVQAVPYPNPKFWRTVFRRRTTPIYRHPDFLPAVELTGTIDEYLTAGTAKINVTDDDDHVWVRAGDSKAGRVGNEWRILITDVAAAVLGKRKEGSSSGQPSLVVRDPEDESWARRASAVELDLDSDDEQDIQHDLTRLAELADMLSEAADIIRSQIPHKNHIWTNSILNRNSGVGLGRDVADLVQDVRRLEITGRIRGTTWPRNGREAKISRNLMGYHPR
ncbi:hypothetical protein OE88DRAFT_477680 [Heliocybe sulcata]|uniref:Uncharacterized protein n=1 Tax=Heliocybe sulcata TaxID=5364 RepID=A0A5C3MVK3_9AGAM|nr:hypothetical protein OE88DRAFT_477680 [Heliocybe sulcata]